MSKLVLSHLPKTWLIDIDGVLFEHNSHLRKGDHLIAATKEFIDKLPLADNIVLLTARKEEYRDATLASLEKFGIRYNSILFNLPTGERILINDTKPGGLVTAYALQTQRDDPKLPEVKLDSED